MWAAGPVSDANRQSRYRLQLFVFDSKGRRLNQSALGQLRFTANWICRQPPFSSLWQPLIFENYSSHLICGKERSSLEPSYVFLRVLQLEGEGERKWAVAPSSFCFVLPLYLQQRTLEVPYLLGSQALPRAVEIVNDELEILVIEPELSIAFHRCV